LISPWYGSDWLVCADSYFSSVQTALECKKVKMRYIGVVKTATKNYPMNHLSKVKLMFKGDRSGVIAIDEANNKPELLAIVWRDWDRRYFIASALSMAEGRPVSRDRWRQVTKDRITPPEKVTKSLPQPQAAETYYEVCGKIDQHNRDKQATLGLERKLKTHDWSKRVNLTILSMCAVDAWKVWSRITVDDAGNRVETQKEFYGHLAAELIDNNYDGEKRRHQSGEKTRPNQRFEIQIQVRFEEDLELI
jgi:Transposase IS4